MRKVIVSRQHLEFDWRNSELLDGDLPEQNNLPFSVEVDANNYGGYWVCPFSVEADGN